MTAGTLLIPGQEEPIPFGEGSEHRSAEIDPLLAAELLNTDLLDPSPESPVPVDCGDERSRAKLDATRLLIARELLVDLGDTRSFHTFGAALGVVDLCVSVVEVDQPDLIAETDHTLEEFAPDVARWVRRKGLWVVNHTSNNAHGAHSLDPDCAFARYYTEIKTAYDPENDEDMEALVTNINATVPGLEASDTEVAEQVVANHRLAERIRPRYDQEGHTGRLYKRLASQPDPANRIPIAVVDGDHDAKGFAYIQGERRTVSRDTLQRLRHPLFVNTTGQLPLIGEALKDKPDLPVDPRRLEVAQAIIFVTIREKFFRDASGQKFRTYATYPADALAA